MVLCEEMRAEVERRRLGGRGKSLEMDVDEGKTSRVPCPGNGEDASEETDRTTLRREDVLPPRVVAASVCKIAPSYAYD